MTRPTRRRQVDDDDEEETPRRRRPVDTDEEDREPPRRRGRVDDDDDEPAPARSRRRAAPEDDDDEDFDAPPRGRRRARAEDDDDEQEERPRRRPGGSSGPAGRAGRRPGGSRSAGRVASGWGGYKKVKDASSDFETKFKPTDKGEVIKLLEPEPFAAFARHWVETRDGKRAFMCPASLETDEDADVPECPLCDVGDKPNSPKAYINVAVLQPGQRPELAVWEIGGSISDQLQTVDKSIGRKTSLTDIYLLASSSGSGLNTKYTLEPLFEDELDEFEVKALTDKQLDGFDLYDASLYEIPSFKELDKVADEIA